MKHNYDDFVLMRVDCDHEDEDLTRITYDLKIEEVDKDLISRYGNQTEKWFQSDLLCSDKSCMFICAYAVDSRFIAHVIIRKDELDKDVLLKVINACVDALKQGLPHIITYKLKLKNSVASA